MKSFFLPVGFVLILASTFVAAAADRTNLSRLRFTGPELFPIDIPIALLHTALKVCAIDARQLPANALTGGDVNGDKRTALVLLAENHLYVFKQKEDKTLAEPEKIPISSAVKAVQVLDVDGDGREDLLLVNWESHTPLRLRLQNADDEPGPCNNFRLSP